MPRNNQGFYQFNCNKKNLICVFCLGQTYFKKNFSLVILKSLIRTKIQRFQSLKIKIIKKFEKTLKYFIKKDR